MNLPMRALTLLGLTCAAGLLSPGRGLAGPGADYSLPASWLCLPGRADVCASPVTSTVVSPDGALTRKTYAPDPAARIDCFYVYPTVSREPTANADMANGPEEQHAAAEQFARFSAVCRTFAPIYRQITGAGLAGAARNPDYELAYGDVRAAWRYYLAHDNQGRGVALVGHSQGARLLEHLIAEEIDGGRAQRLLVSAIIPGTNVQVPAGVAGASFRHIALCRSADQAGCVIAYSSFLASSPPPPQAYFGKSDGRGLRYACVDPGELLGHSELNAELPTVGRARDLLGTPLVENPGLISAACVTADGKTFLAITLKPAGAGAETLNRALTDLSSRAPAWGLHGIDVNLALGDLVEIVGRQGKAWAAAQR